MDLLLSFGSYFIPEKAIFGRYPSQDQVEFLQKFCHVTHFVDLTSERETLPGYAAKNIIKLPIEDGRIPQKEGFDKFIEILLQILNTGVLYIHCRGGHGRSGLVAACILGRYYDYPSTASLKLINKFHNQRTNMKPRMRKMGSPQTESQRYFVRNYLELHANPIATRLRNKSN